jgi:hypothetical protein
MLNGTCQKGELVEYRVGNENGEPLTVGFHFLACEKVDAIMLTVTGYPR